MSHLPSPSGNGMTTAVRRCPLLAPTVFRYSSGRPPILLPVSRWITRAIRMDIRAMGPLGAPFAPRVPPGGTSTVMHHTIAGRDRGVRHRATPPLLVARGVRCSARGIDWHGHLAAVAQATCLLEVDDLAAKRHHGDGNELEVRQTERDSDNRDAHQDAGDDVADGEPPAGENEPDDVPDDGARAGVCTLDERAAEWPQAEQCDTRRGDPKRVRDDEDEHHQGDDRVAQRQHEASEDQPDHVEQEPHAEHLIVAMTSRSGARLVARSGTSAAPSRATPFVPSGARHEGCRPPRIAWADGGGAAGPAAG